MLLQLPDPVGLFPGSATRISKCSPSPRSGPGMPGSTVRAS